MCVLLTLPVIPQGTELAVIGAPVRDAFVAFSTETGRKVRTGAPLTLAPSLTMLDDDFTQLHLEIEPGTFLLANSCSIVSTVQARARNVLGEAWTQKALTLVCLRRTLPPLLRAPS